MKCSCDGDGGGGANLPLIDDTPFLVNQQQQQQQQQLPRNELLYQTLADHGVLLCFGRCVPCRSVSVLSNNKNNMKDKIAGLFPKDTGEGADADAASTTGADQTLYKESQHTSPNTYKTKV